MDDSSLLTPEGKRMLRRLIAGDAPPDSPFIVEGEEKFVKFDGIRVRIVGGLTAEVSLTLDGVAYTSVIAKTPDGAHTITFTFKEIWGKTRFSFI